MSTIMIRLMAALGSNSEINTTINDLEKIMFELQILTSELEAEASKEKNE